MFPAPLRLCARPWLPASRFLYTVTPIRKCSLFLEGLLEVLQYDARASRWLTASSGDVVCIPGDVEHAIRNSSSGTVTLLLATTPNIYEFFRELGRSFYPEQKAGPPTRDNMERSLSLAVKYKYWISSPQENESIGLTKILVDRPWEKPAIGESPSKIGGEK
jgi:hypothetical protein